MGVGWGWGGLGVGSQVPVSKLYAMMQYADKSEYEQGRVMENAKTPLIIDQF